MPAKQFIAISEQTVRSAINGTPAYKFYPITGKLEPTPKYKDDIIKEWRAVSTAQGDVYDERSSTSWDYSLEGRIYPGAELALLIKYLMGYAATTTPLSSPNSAAARTVYSSASEMYGDDAQLLDGAIAIVPNVAKGTTTYCQKFTGGRPKSAQFTFKGGEAASFKIDFIGGPWVGAVEQTAITGVSFPASKALRSVPKIYFGSGAITTGTAPNYTEVAPGTMSRALPDDLTITMDNGIEDVYKMNDIEGPSVSERARQWSITAEFTIDFADPASGWSSYDAWAAGFSDVQYTPFMMVLKSSEIIPSCSTANYDVTIYVPKMKVTLEQPERKNDGSKSKIKVKLESRLDETENIAAYVKLLF